MADVAVLDQPEDLEMVRREWSSLADEVDARIFTRPEWCLPWWLHLGRGRLAVATVRDAGRLIALAPFHVRRRAGLEVVRFLGHGLGTIGRVLVAPGHEAALAALWDATLADRRRVLQLLEYEAGAPDLATLEARLPTTSSVEHDVCPVIGLQGATSVARWRRKLRRVSDRTQGFPAGDAGPPTIEVGRDVEALDRLMPEIVAVFDAAEAHRPRLHLLRPPLGDFTNGVLREAAATDRLRLVVVRVAGAPAAFVIGLRGGSSMNYWVPRFDPVFSRLSPGHLGILALVEESMAMGLRELDLGLGDAEYKRRWSTGEYRTVAVSGASRPGLLPLHQMVEGAADRARRWLAGRRTRRER